MTSEMRTTKGHNRSNEKARNAANAAYSQIANAERRPFAPYDLAIARRTHARLEHEFSRAQHYIYRLDEVGHPVLFAMPVHDSRVFRPMADALAKHSGDDAVGRPLH